MDRKISLAVITALSLSACNNIEDSTDSVAESLEQQNEILSNQNDLLQQQLDTTTEASVDKVTLVGELGFFDQDAPITSATVKYKLALEWSDAITIENGVYQIPDLPGNSDIKLLFESPNGEFVAKEVSGQTDWAGDGGSYQHIYSSVVTESVYSFEVIDSDTLEAINDLEFSGSFYTSASFNQFDFEYTSTFNLESGKYEITLPDNLPINDLFASLDVDNDGERDYQYGSWSQSHITLGLNQITNEEVTYLTEYELIVESPSELIVRVSVIDSDLNHLENATLVAEDESESETDPTSTFNTETQQHDITVSILDSVSLSLPAFEEHDLFYESRTITISKNEDDNYNVRAHNGYYYSNYEVSGDEGAIDIVVQIAGSSSSDFFPSVSPVTRSSSISAPDYQYKSFYSGPLELVEGGVELVREDQIVVTRGNEKADDFVLPGTTTVFSEDQAVDVVTTLSLNDTLLAVEPATTLNDGATYQYRISRLKDKNKDVEFNPNHYLRFVAAQETSDLTFDINDLVLDNANYTNNGTTIITENTASQVSSSTDYSRSAYLFFPASIYTLKNLTMKLVNTVDDGVSQNFSQTYTIVEDGQIKQASKVFVLEVAENETIQSSSSIYSYVRGTTLSEGYHWRLSYGIDYLSDDTDSNTNNASFEYIYETLDGEIHSGTITLSAQ